MEDEMESNFFYMVWKEGGSAPTYKHNDLHSATEEAKRICRKLGGGKFYVLKAVNSVEKTPEFLVKSVGEKDNVCLDCQIPF